MLGHKLLLHPQWHIAQSEIQIYQNKFNRPLRNMSELHLPTITLNIADPQTIAGCAERAIAQCFTKFDKYEKKVLQDNDPEPLHQMRVRMRR